MAPDVLASIFRRVAGWAAAASVVAILGWLALGPSRAPAPATGAEATDIENPQILMEGFVTEITRDGLLQQRIEAQWSRLDEQRNIIDLQQIDMTFYENGAFRGRARCGAGRLWLKARPADGAGANDALLSDGVLYRFADGSLLQTPSMRFRNAAQTLESDAGFVHQIAGRDAFWVLRADRFLIKLLLEKSAVDAIHYEGSPAVELHKTDQAVIEP